MKKRIGFPMLAMTLSLGLGLCMPVQALAEESTTTYVESAETLAQASANGLQQAVTTGTMTETAVISGPSGATSYDPAALGYTVVGQSMKTNTETIGLTGGASITMIKGSETGQQVCLVISDGQGHTVVVDGGLKTNAPYLGKYIQNHGGSVDAWLLTHPHGDHVGALAVILERQAAGGMLDFAGFSVGDIYYSFAPMEFYQQYEESHRLPIIEEIYQDLAAYDQSKVHYNSPAGTIMDFGGIHVEILNQPYQFTVNSGNNTSIVYKITVGGKTLLVTGDLPYEAAEQLLADVGAEALKADIVQMAHHGQHGGSPAFYQAVAPSYALWPTHSALWETVHESYDLNQETYTVALTKSWLDALFAKSLVMADGDWVLN